MNRHALYEPVPPRTLRRMAFNLHRQVTEWAVWRATVGPEIAAMVRADYAAQDAWENEGGACAYAD